MSCEFTQPHQCGGECGDRTVHAHLAAATPPAGPNPFAVGQLPAELSADDEEDELGQMLVELVVTYLAIFVVAFAIGFAVGSF